VNSQLLVDLFLAADSWFSQTLLVILSGRSLGDAVKMCAVRNTDE
jgi:hypothetical protein